MKRTIVLLLLVLACIGSLIGYVTFRFVQGIRPSLEQSGQVREIVDEPTVEPEQEVGFPAYTGPLSVPAGFSISVYADGFKKPRILATDPKGRLAVSDSDAGSVYLLEYKGSTVARATLIAGLDRPHGIEFHDGHLYVAETRTLSRYVYDPDTGAVGARERLADLPFAGGHFTRTIRFGADDRLYLSIGSSCNVCRETDERLAAVMVFDPVTWKPQVFARGLRNTVGLAINPQTKELWGVDNGRDWLGDNLPPEEVNIIRAGADYGWPICYGKKIHDINFDKNQYFRDPCADTVAPVFELPAHNAPLGLTFVTSPKFPSDWQGDLLVTLHGSWNRSEPDGYKVVRLNVEGDTVRSSEDFITGFIGRNGVIARPVDVLFGADGALYLTDDKAGAIYRVTVDAAR